MARLKPPKDTRPSESPDQPRKTKTLPDDQRGFWFDGVDPVTALLVHGSARIFDLPRDVRRFMLGAGADCDIAIPTDFLSALHLVLERRGSRLRVLDQDTKNGTYFGGHREQAFEVRPGDTFIAGAIQFLVMNDEMRAAHPVLIELLGGDEGDSLYNEPFRSRPSDALIAAMTTRNLLITGGPGCDHVRLARTIHQVSPLRERPFVELEELPAPSDRAGQRKILDEAARSTLIIKLGEKSEVLDPAFASMIFSTSYHVRVIACAPSYEVAARVIRETNVREMGPIALLPLTRRFGRSIGRLLDRFLAEKGSLRFADLTPQNQAAIEAYSWPDNFDDLRWVSDVLATLHRVGSFRQAAEELHVSQSTVHDRLTKLGVTRPLTTKE